MSATPDIQNLIVSTANSYGVDPNLALAVAQQESGLNQSAVSKAGAIGVFQLMPGTAAGLGVDPNNLQGNVQGGIQYLSQLLTQFNGNTSLALAAYNAGPGAVSKYGGIPPYPETQNYVSSILGTLPSAYSTGYEALAVTSDTMVDQSGLNMGGIDLSDPVTIAMLVGAGVLAWWFLSR